MRHSLPPEPASVVFNTMAVLATALVGARRHCLHNHMRIGAAKSERAHAANGASLANSNRNAIARRERNIKAIKLNL